MSRRESIFTRVVRSKLFDYFLTLLALAMTVTLGLSIYWIAKDYNIITWNIAHYEMQKEEYVVGEPLTFRTAFCKVGHYKAELIYHIEDGVTYLIPAKASRSDEGCRDFISSTIETPNLPEGEYKLRGVITYQVNPLRTVTYQMTSESFKIINE